MTFRTTEEVLDGVHVVRLFGELDVSTVPSVRAALSGLLEHRRAYVLDLTGLEFLDSSGLKVLDEAQEIVTERGDRVEIACPPGRVLRLLEITGVDDYLSVHASVDSAAAATRG